MTALDNASAVDQTRKPLDDIAGAYITLGVVALREFFPMPRVAELAAESDRLLELFKAGSIDPVRIAYRPKMTGGRTFERFDPVCDISPVCEEISRDPQLLALVGRLIGDEPCLFKDKLIYKLEGDRGYGLHQDYPYFGLTESLKHSVTTVAIAIDGMSLNDGCLQFSLGCHRRIQPAPIDEPRDVDPAAVAGAETWIATVPPGSLIIFHTLTPHGSGPNRSPSTRRVLYLTYIRKADSHLRETYYKARAANLR